MAGALVNLKPSCRELEKEELYYSTRTPEMV